MTSKCVHNREFTLLLNGSNLPYWQLLAKAGTQPLVWAMHASFDIYTAYHRMELVVDDLCSPQPGNHAQLANKVSMQPVLVPLSS